MNAEISCGVYSRSPSADGLGRAHPALDRADGPLGGQEPLVARRGADEQAALGVQADDRGEDRLAVLAKNFGLAVADDRHFAVGGAQVDSKNGFHEGSGVRGQGEILHVRSSEASATAVLAEWCATLAVSRTQGSSDNRQLTLRTARTSAKRENLALPIIARPHLVDHQARRPLAGR